MGIYVVFEDTYQEETPTGCILRGSPSLRGMAAIRPHPFPLHTFASLSASFVERESDQVRHYSLEASLFKITYSS